MRDYKVLVSPKAKEMLDEHIEFLAQVNEASARNKKNARVVFSCPNAHHSPNVLLSIKTA
jgi:hypothetical protein